MKIANIYRGGDNESYLIVNAEDQDDGIYWSPEKGQYVSINPLSVLAHTGMPFNRLFDEAECPDHIVSYLREQRISFS